MIKPKNTSWNKVAEWYDSYLEDREDTYHALVVLPNLLRLMKIRPDEKILDLACGQGFFSREFAKAGALVTGVDSSSELISLARKRSLDQMKRLQFKIASAHSLPFLYEKSIDMITLIFALQNIVNVDDILRECGRVLRTEGKICLVMNHPVLRVPKQSSWGWDEKQHVQYRRLDSYMSESKNKIEMNPSTDTQLITWSFHRPLQWYFKFFVKNGLMVTHLEEWISPKKSENGPRSGAEDRARKEIPLFLYLELKKSC